MNTEESKLKMLNSYIQEHIESSSRLLSKNTQYLCNTLNIGILALLITLALTASTFSKGQLNVIVWSILLTIALHMLSIQANRGFILKKAAIMTALRHDDTLTFQDKMQKFKQIVLAPSSKGLLLLDAIVPVSFMLSITLLVMCMSYNAV